MIRENQVLYDQTGLIDLGIISAASTKYETNFRDGLYWVRKVVIIARADQPWQPYVQRQDTQNGWGTPLFGGTITTAIGQWAELETTIALGSKARFGMSVPGASPTTTAQMYVQFFN